MDNADLPGLALSAAQAQALAESRCEDPFALLGPHEVEGGVALRVYLPGAERVDALVEHREMSEIALTPMQIPGLFIGQLPQRMPYRLRVQWPQATQETADPYAFGPLLDDADLRQFAAGLHPQLSACLGARPQRIEGIDGLRFAVWAPNARRVSVVGDFNSWDGRRHPMRRRIEAGVWELFVPDVGKGTRYQFEILGPNGVLPLKADPLALEMEASPGTAAVVADPAPFVWRDQRWLAQSAQRQSASAPLSIYEVHAPSWRRPGGRSLDWDALADTLIDYVAELGFTHIELMPVSAHPFGGSWGYQPLGLYAPHPALGSPTQLKAFIDRCHAREVGVIVDWVPAHFPADAHGLAHFDGTALYEHADPREGFQPDWNTLIYNLGRNEVCAHLIGSALHWLDEYHVDGLRVDAVASMLYRDYSRRADEWIPNRHGGRENLEAVAFLQRFNEVVNARHPGVLTIAEESTAWPGVTAEVARGGLGFSFKWNMGWMHDSLRYLSTDPLFRSHRHHDLTFGLSYAFSERYLLPLSHDEVVHGKRSLLGRMPGDPWQQHANLRAYLAFMWTHPGKKMLFMGGEIAQAAEWNHDGELDWEALAPPTTEANWKRGMHRLVTDLNRLYRAEGALHVGDSRDEGFFWIVGDDTAQSVFVFGRRGDADAPPIVVACNFTPVPRPFYRYGVPGDGRWRLLLNTDAEVYGGSGVAMPTVIEAQPEPSHGLRHSLSLTLPPLATVLLRQEVHHDGFGEEGTTLRRRDV